MAIKEALGKCACPDCGFVDAEIKLAKGGLAYRWCPDCNLQTFSRNDKQHERMMASIKKPVTVSGTVPAYVPAEVKPEPEKPKKSGFDLGL